MTIGIDISQLAFENTGVANYLENILQELVEIDKNNKFVLFFSSLRKDLRFKIKDLRLNPNVTIKQFKIPPTLLDLIWNRLHIMPIENFIGNVDVFITSDWTEPPVMRAKKATILYDLLVYKYPEEMHNKTEFNPLKLLIRPNIVSSQKRKLAWVKKEADRIFCISQSTANDAREILGIDKNKLSVVYPGLS
jgi:hypothetical protein